VGGDISSASPKCDTHLAKKQRQGGAVVPAEKLRTGPSETSSTQDGVKGGIFVAAMQRNPGRKRGGHAT
jgi:hypothetical protein